MMRLTFVGMGYLGATYAICFAELGYEVIGIDIDSSKVDKLAQGSVPFHEPGLEEMLHRNLATGRLRFTTDFADAGQFGDVHFLCVGTPERIGGHKADLSYLQAAVQSLAPHLRSGALVVGKSTVPVGTTQWVRGLLTDQTLEVAWCPEFLQEGRAVEDVLRPTRLVLGVDSERATELLHRAHKGITDLAAAEGRDVPVVITDFATAELAKVAANSFIATKIAFINGVADVCEATGANVTDLARIVGHDPRIGHQLLGAGIGFGGGCLTKDIRAFQSRARELGVGESLRLLHEVDLLNQRRREHLVELVAAHSGRSAGPHGVDLSGLRIAVLGVTFKPDTDDVRESPGLAIAGLLHEAGATVTVFDPQGMENAQRILPMVTYAESTVDACRAADVVCLLTPWQEFRALDPADLLPVVSQPRIVDGMNALLPSRWGDAGWAYQGVGKPPGGGGPAWEIMANQRT